MTTQVFRGITYTELDIQESNQRVFGTANPDWFVVEGNNNVVNTRDGNDVVLLAREIDLIYLSTTFNGEVLQTSPLSSNPDGISAIVDTGAGDDYVSFGSGNYKINLGSGNNFLDDYGGNYLYDADGTNIIGLGTTPKVIASAGAGDDIFYLGGFANRTIDAGKGNNLIFLGSGDANIKTGSGNDIITSELSIATYIFSATGLPLYNQTINAGDGDNQIAVAPYGETTVKTGCGEDFILAYGIPGSSDTKIFTGNGNDTIITIDTNSTIKSGSGDDLIFAGSGDDTILVGNGNDLVNLRGGTVSLPDPLSSDTNLFGSSVEVIGGGNDTVYLGQGRDTVILGSIGFATIYGFDCNDRLDVTGLNASFTQIGHDTLINSSGSSLGVLKGYTGSVHLA
ncbi:hypothetical protein IQ274_23805 [Nostoc sp. LEGE 12447]|uniref:calcium-binding protein n=1 Tax=Nostoc sp. LEGE 12447 TaxID=1828640 RepID=UPI001883C97E|nr:calcium-binding protein [Nostoc sp. LEGE 12447]MBE9001161.1 hypothetical protein [Nostoc sp. LEGE 12447]